MNNEAGDIRWQKTGNVHTVNARKTESMSQSSWGLRGWGWACMPQLGKPARKTVTSMRAPSKSGNQEEREPSDGEVSCGWSCFPCCSGPSAPNTLSSAAALNAIPLSILSTLFLCDCCGLNLELNEMPVLWGVILIKHTVELGLMRNSTSLWFAFFYP